MFSKTKKTKKT